MQMPQCIMLAKTAEQHGRAHTAAAQRSSCLPHPSLIKAGTRYCFVRAPTTGHEVIVNASTPRQPGWSTRRNVRSTSRLMRDCGVLRCTDRSTENTALPTYEIRAKVHVHRRLPTWAQCPSAHISSIRISRSPAGRMDPAAGTRGTPTSEPEIQVRTGTTPLCGQARGSLASHNGKSRLRSRASWSIGNTRQSTVGCQAVQGAQCLQQTGM